MFVLVGCASTPEPETPQSGSSASPPSSPFECPAFDGRADFDLSNAFGIERPLAARIERMMRLTSELEASAEKLTQETSALCGNLALALTNEPLPASENACEVALARASAAWPSLRDAGFSVSVGDISCSLPRDALARCAGECITGKPDVFSQVTCDASPGGVASVAVAPSALDAAEAAVASCGFDFAMPDASFECATQCGVRALRDVSCGAEVDVRIGGADVARYENLVGVLRRDLPRLASLGRSLMPQAIRASANVNRFVDDLGVLIDEMRANERIERRAVVGAVLAACVGPRLGSAVRAGADLQAMLGDAERIRAQLMAR